MQKFDRESRQRGSSFQERFGCVQRGVWQRWLQHGNSAELQENIFIVTLTDDDLAMRSEKTAFRRLSASDWGECSVTKSFQKQYLVFRSLDFTDNLGV